MSHKFQPLSLYHQVYMTNVSQSTSASVKLGPGQRGLESLNGSHGTSQQAVQTVTVSNYETAAAVAPVN